MVDIEGWVQQQWFSLVQSLGILGGLVFAGLSSRHEAATREVTSLLTMAEQHRQLWTEASRRPELARLFQEEVDLVACPITRAEEEFLNVMIVHYNTGWELAGRGETVSIKALKIDAKGVFSLPIPKAVWKQTKHLKDPRFARFIDELLQ